MKHIILIAALILQSILLYAQGQNYTDKANDLIEKAVKENESVGLVAGFSINGEIKWQNALGFSDEDRKQPFKTSTKTRIASISKPMTAIAIMQLYEQGKLKLDVPIQAYLPSFPKKKEGEITVKQLLQHSAGVSSYKNNREQENTSNYPTLDDAVSIFKDRDLISKPGQEFNYTTYGYVILGSIIEKVSGMTYEHYMQTNVWDKAGMKNTGIEYEDKAIPEMTTIYHKNSKGKIKEAECTNVSDRIPGGGIYSTVTDMLKFGDAILNHTLVTESTFQMMVENRNLKTQGNGNGIGWYLYGQNPNYGNVIGHNGTQTGASTFLMLLPEQMTTIVVLSNTSGAIQTVSNITIQLFDVAAEAKN